MPIELTFRVSRNGEEYKLATGTLPDRPRGASGSGAGCGSMLLSLYTLNNAFFLSWLLC
jgi:hypothetical protein